MTYVWVGGVSRKPGWYIVKNWTSEDEVYKHGPFEKFEDAKAFAQKKKIDVRRIKAKENAEKIKQDMIDTVVTLTQKVGEEDKLYGSVTSMDIANELEKMGISIDRRKIQLDKPIKNLGEFDVPIKLHPEVRGSVKVIVEPEKIK